MSNIDRRKENRVNPSMRFSPISCVLIVDGTKVPLELVNFHFRGACFKVNIGDFRIQEKETYLIFKIGEKELKERILFRLIWETISDNGLVGVEFSTESSYVLARAERFQTHNTNTPIVSSQDPLDPNRIVYFKAINVSTTGMLLSTSLTNKHIFPGMELRCAVLEIPGMGKADVDLFIENVRSSEDNKTVRFGVSMKGFSHSYHDLISKYLSNLGSLDNNDDRFEKLSSNGLLVKHLSKHLTIREIKTEHEYKQVLKLRYLGYKNAGKVSEAISEEQMGDGLKNEGLVIGAYLGGQLVGSAEFRFNHIHGLRLSKQYDLKALPKVRSENLAEVNKLVIHPKAQKTDIVLGIFQKIHALAMLNGRPDGLISAEDGLVPLYQRLGFHKIGVSFAHPTKARTNLNLMIMYSEAYASSQGMNAYAWSKAFGETQKFFDEIGVNRSHTTTARALAEKILTPAAIGLINKVKKKKKKKTFENQSLSTAGTQNKKSVADPKWTKQELNATIMLPYVLEADDMIGIEKVTKILLEFELHRDYFRSTNNWVSIAMFNQFVAKFGAAGGNKNELNRRAGYRANTKEVLGANYFLVKHLASPGMMLKSFEKYLPKFNKTRTLKVISSTATSCRFRIYNIDRALLPTDPSAKENWIAVVDAYVLMQTGRHAKITTVQSSFDGADYCEYVVEWTPNLWRLKNIVGFLAAGALTGLAIFKMQSALATYEGKLIAALTTLTIACIGFFIQSKISSRRYKELMLSRNAFEKEAEEKYVELQGSKSILEKSYQEGKLLETLNREIQTSEDVARIFEVALDSLCNKFHFRRAFIMLIDNEHKFLQTAAVTSIEEIKSSDIWQYKVDVTIQRDNPLVLSSVYRTGQSIIVSNIDDHKFQLNETSRRLIESLGTKGFAMVPIPSDSRNWGVMIADKGEGNEIITRRDLVAMQRIAQSIGMALDKKAKLDEEVRARNIFQKFVPSAVVENTLGKKDLTLGGEVREAVCLFLDIRDFTKMSNTLPPQTTVDILNRVFGLLQKTVRSSGGVIDKFLGDGALVTWGAVPGPHPSPTEAIQAAITFIEQLPTLEKDLRIAGVPNLRIGIGMHKGPVIAGNIGSNERMEFTVIGNTVNMASRLEQLSKVLGTTLVISSDLMPFAPNSELWKTHDGIQVRGIEQPISVSSYHPASSTAEKKSEESA